jgi:hypothetical protein
MVKATNLIRWFTSPENLDDIARNNFLNVEIDGIGVGLASAAAPFLPIFLTRLGGSSLDVSLLSSMPAIAGLILSIPLGNFLQSRRKIVPWFSLSRLAYLLSYAVIGLIIFFIPKEHWITAILIIWALATIPQTMLSISFSVVMNAVAGPGRRFDLMSRRWSILGFSTAITTLLIGQALVRMGFPINYQVVFISLSIGTLASFYFSSHIVIQDSATHKVREAGQRRTLASILKDYFTPMLREKPFTTFLWKRFIYLIAANMAIPLFPLYFVREINAPDSWIAVITTTQTTIMVIGYFIWMQQSRRRGNRSVLLWTTAGLAIYPIMTALTHQPWLITIYAATSGIFQAGLDLIFFDELMRTVPEEYSATFVSFAQGIQYLSAIFGPLLGSVLADRYGSGMGLIISGIVRLIGFGLFFR